jgi:hypothetical protein
MLRVRSGINIARGGWSDAGDLHDNGVLARLGKMRAVRWLRIKAAGRKRLQCSAVERVAIPDVPGAVRLINAARAPASDRGFVLHDTFWIIGLAMRNSE